MIDLFSTPDALPTSVLAILGKFAKSENDYKDCTLLVEELNSVGYTCEFGLDAVSFNLQKIDINKIINDLQSQNLEKCVKEVKSNFQFQEVTEIHAKAIFNNNGKVYGFLDIGMVLIQKADDFTKFEKYFID